MLNGGSRARGEIGLPRALRDMSAHPPPWRWNDGLMSFELQDALGNELVSERLLGPPSVEPDVMAMIAAAPWTDEERDALAGRIRELWELSRWAVARWAGKYHCCPRSKSRQPGHDDDCPLLMLGIAVGLPP